ncbi:MAG: hypothetical protein WCY62_07740 [Clostridia bacterium]
MMISINEPKWLQLTDITGDILYGCSQEWFRTTWQRMSGCGPCTASNIVLYFQRSGRIQTHIAVDSKPDFMRLMESVWKYVTPKYMGMHLVSQFYTGLNNYFKSINAELKCYTLDIPKHMESRPLIPVIVDFIAAGLSADSPVAFLNLSNGTVKDLDEWHWVTVIAMETNQDTGDVYLEIYDDRKDIKINFTQWYASTKLGGGFIYYT